MEEFEYIIEGSVLTAEKQNKKMKTTTGGKSGKQSVNSLSQLKRFPGVKIEKRK